MKLLHDLATQTLLGSDRRAAVLPEPAGELGRLLQAACPAGEELEVRVLRCAGSLALCAAAGYLPAVAEETPPPACPAEQSAIADDPQLLSTLQQIFDDGPDSLRREACARLTSKGCRLPPSLLTHALSLGRKSHGLRPSLLAVIGHRGQWLASLNPDWAYAVGGPDPTADLSLWEQGSQEQRKRLLGTLRQRDPDQARALLQDGFSQIDARERASLLETIGDNLSPADEDFLESLLGDRSKEVRQRAANLLAALPGSHYSLRMAQRMAACLGHERKLFRNVHTLEAPACFGADWKTDALEESRPKNESLGERAWWLYQIARALPLAWWQEATGLSPAELMKWVRGTDWSEAILRAWAEALQRRPDALWAGEFLLHADAFGGNLNIFELLACLPTQAREQHWLAMLKGKSRGYTRGQLLARLVEELSSSQEAPSEGFSRHILAEVHKLVDRATYPSDGLYEIGRALPELVSLIPPACFAEATEGWPVGSPETEYFSKTLASMLSIVEKRKILHQILR